MDRHYRSYKTEIDPIDEQIKKIETDFTTCKMVFNLYLIIALNQYKKEGTFGDHDAFLDWFYSSYLKTAKYRINYPKDLNYDAIRRVTKNVEKVMKKYINGEINEPKCKDLKYGQIKLYFTSGNNNDYSVICERHRIYIPEFGWIRLKEKGYFLPSNADHQIISGTISKKAGRYYISLNYNVSDSLIKKEINERGIYREPIGIDLGISHFAVLSDGRVYENINYDESVKRLEKKIHRKQRALDRKIQAAKLAGRDYTQGSHYNINVLELQKLYKRLDEKRLDCINKIVGEIVKSHPAYVAIEDLHIQEMVSDRRFSRAISDLFLREFRVRLIKKSRSNGIEVRVIDKFFPSSKRCSCCGRINHDLKLSDRVFKCECGFEVDRDFNASINIRDCKEYYIAKVDDDIVHLQYGPTK